MQDDHTHDHGTRVPLWKWTLAACLLIAGLLLFMEQSFGVLPYLFLLACPLMHIFGHGHHHGGHGRHDGRSAPGDGGKGE